MTRLANDCGVNQYSPELQPILFDPERMYHNIQSYAKLGWDITTSVTEEVITNKTVVTYIGLHIRMRRNYNPYVFQYYMPAAAIVIISQISFIIPPSSIPGRVGLVATQFLTLTNIFISEMVR